jgi:transposase
MAKSYGDDLRRKLLQAHDRGEGTLEQLAERFSVSAPWAWKISAQRKRTGQMERVEQRRGTVRKVIEKNQPLRRDPAGWKAWRRCWLASVSRSLAWSDFFLAADPSAAAPATTVPC